MDSTFEEIHAIWTQQLLNHDKIDELHSEIVMDHPRIFMPNSVEWRIKKHGQWYIEVQFDPINREVYQVEVTTLGDGIARYRWVNPNYLHLYHKNNFEYQMGDAHIKEVNVDSSPSKILEIARDVVDDTPSDETETIELDMTDAEIALIARAAHAQDITINQFMNNVIKDELDRVMPDWREEIKRSHY